MSVPVGGTTGQTLLKTHQLIMTIRGLHRQVHLLQIVAGKTGAVTLAKTDVS